MGRGGASKTSTLNSVRTMIDSMRRPATVRQPRTPAPGTAIDQSPFVHMGRRYGGPILNTAATRMYWKHDMRNSVEFSKFVASSLLSSALGSFGGGG